MSSSTSDSDTSSTAPVAEVSADRFRAAFAKALIGMALVRPDGGFLEVNDAFCEMLGYPRDELLELRFADVTHPEDRELNERRFREMLAGERQELRLEKRYLRADGRHVWALLSSHLERDGEGRPSFFVSQVLDITERKEAEEAKALVEHSRNVFLATLNHGLRTPVNGILGMSRLLVEGVPEAHRRNAEVIHSSAEGLLGLVDELLDLSRIEAGQLVLDEEDFLLRELVDECVELLRHRARAKRLDLRHTIKEATPDAVRGDPRRLRQVLLNLIGNAVRYTRRGFVLVTVEPADAADDASRLRFSVRDTGAGIAPELVTNIFEPFTRDDRNPGGNGLGLAISHRLAGLMDGELGVDSTPGQGSTFTLTVPLAPARDPAALTAAPDAVAAPPSDRRRGDFHVLVAEDDEINRMLALQVLTDAGYRADVVDNGIEALEALEARRYDLILMDCQMPELDGFGASRLIRQLEKGQAESRPPVRIVAVTARTLASDREKCVEAGMDDFVAKPYRAEELVRTVDLNLGVEPRPAAAGDGRRDGDPVLDAEVFEQLRDFSGPSQDNVLAALVEVFTRERPERYEALRAALEESDGRRLAEISHKLISASGSVGAYRLAKVAGELEMRAREDDLEACRELLAELATEYESAEAALRDHLATAK